MDAGNPSILRRGEAENRYLFGPFFIGIVVCFFFWGIQIAQSYYYYKNYRATDRRWVKGAVGLLFITDAIQTVCASEGSWRYMVEAWGDEAGFILIRSWGVDVLPLTDAATTVIVNVFYAHKIWVLLKSPHNKIWTAIVLLLSCLQLAGGVGASAFMVSINNDIATVHRAKTWICIWLVTASVNDIIIAALMCLKLSRSRTGFKRTDDIISKMIRLTVETGLATAIIQILDLVLYLGWPFQAYHAVPTFISPKVYSNSMLALLNSRQTLQIPVSLASRQDKGTVDGIQIHTTQTVSTPHDFELKDQPTTPSYKPRSQNERPFGGDLDESPFSHKV